MLLVRDVVADYLTSCEAGGLSPATVAAYGYGLRSLLASVGAERALSSLTAADLRGWLAGLFRAGRSGSTVQQCYRSAHSWLTWCVTVGHLAGDPMAGVRRPRVDDPVRRWLSAEQASALVAALAGGRHAERDVSAGLVMLDCGLRRAEVCGLELAHVDLAGCRLTVRRGKGGRGRVVPISPAVVYALRCWLVVRPASAGRVGFGGSAAALYQMVRRAGQRAGLEISPHGLRHTFATLYGGPLDDLQKILGHAEIATTISIYRHRLDADVARDHALRSPLAQMARGRQLELGLGGGL